MNLKKLAIIFLTILFLGCIGKGQKFKEHISGPITSKNETGCWSDMNKQNIVTAIFNTDDLKTYTKIYIENNLPVQIIKNKFITDKLEITTNGQQILLIDSTANIDLAFEIKIKKINCHKLKFEVWLDYEHANIRGKVVKKNENWIVEVISHGIVD